ncbi:MAG: hypothetical protein RL430_2106 [Actinomycetota bacterium]
MSGELAAAEILPLEVEPDIPFSLEVEGEIDTAVSPEDWAPGAHPHRTGRPSGAPVPMAHGSAGTVEPPTTSHRIMRETEHD